MSESLTFHTYHTQENKMSVEEIIKSLSVLTVSLTIVAAVMFMSILPYVN